jgi:hypothetical protein
MTWLERDVNLLGVGKLVRGIAIVTVAVCSTACGGGGGGGAANSMPVVGTSAFTTNENVALPGQLTATDPSGGQVTFAQSGSPTSGTIKSFTPAGAFVYQPTANFVGSDSFKVTATDAAGNMTTATITITVHANNAPTATNYVKRADGTALASINVLANSKDPDGDPLTVSITQTPLVGTATVNADGSVAITALPSDFKGLTTFKYKVTDPSGASATASAAIFVGADPFRAVFAGDKAANGMPEVYLTDFAADPLAITAASQGTLRLAGFATADNGATVVYRVQDSANSANTGLAYVKTSDPSTQVSIPLPANMAPVRDANGLDQYRVSPDGNWIAVIAGHGPTQAMFIVSTAGAITVNQVTPASAVYLTLPRFSQDSKTLFFLASPATTGVNKSLYLVALASPATTTLISAPVVANTDDVEQYSISRDQTKILIEANRGGVVGFYFIDPSHLQTESLINTMLVPGQTIIQSTIASPPGLGGSSTGDKIAYTVQSLLASNTYVADVSATPAPTLVASTGAGVLSFRPDDNALLYSNAGDEFEAVFGSATPPQMVGGGANGWYDSTGNIVLLEQFLPSGGSPPSFPALAQTVRGAFGTATTPVGTDGKAAQYINVTGFDRAVVLLGEGPTTGPPATGVNLTLVNALAPKALLPLADFQTPVQLTSDIAEVVTY